jgi:hypothetical protein
MTNTNAYMLAGTPTNWSRLGWQQAEMTQWTGFNTQWAPLYAKYSDKKGSRTTAITEQLHLIIKQCIALDKTNHLLDRIAASPNATIIDLETFRIKKGLLQDNSHTQRRAEIAESLVVGLQVLGGGDIAVKCRTSHDSKRSSLADGADCVQYAYQVGGSAPVNVDDAGLRKETSTHAAFTLHLGQANSGKTLYIFFRWYNTKHPALAAHWNAMQTLLVV